jgi:hypothetical protein
LNRSWRFLDGGGLKAGSDPGSDGSYAGVDRFLGDGKPMNRGEEIIQAP